MTTSFSMLPDNYIQKFPSQVPVKAAQSFIVTALINIMTGSASNVVLTGSCLAATATIIEAVVRPIIKSIFPQNPAIATMAQIIISTTTASSLASAIAPCFGGVYKTTSVLLSILAWMTLNENFNRNNEAMAMVL